MNKTLKFIIIAINLGMLYLAYEWSLKTDDHEPKIVFLGQLAVIFGLLAEGQVSKIFTKGIDNSNVKIRRGATDKVHTENVKDSTIDIQ